MNQPTTLSKAQKKEFDVIVRERERLLLLPEDQGDGAGEDPEDSIYFEGKDRLERLIQKNKEGVRNAIAAIDPSRADGNLHWSLESNFEKILEELEEAN